MVGAEISDQIIATATEAVLQKVEIIPRGVPVHMEV